MRPIDEIVSCIASAKAEYLIANEELPSSKVIPFSNKVKELQKELSDTISNGANVCPVCGNKPIGMIFRTQNVGGVTVNLYEVGCLNCVGISSRGASPEETVQKWNRSQYWKK